MQEMAPLADWQAFYVIMGGAAASLTGLMFVVVTLISGVNLNSDVPGDGIATFSTPSVIHFCSALLTAVLLSAPWRALWSISLLLGLLGLAGIYYVVIVLRRARRLTSYQPVLEDWIWHTVFPMASYIAYLIAAILLLSDPELALFIVAAATLLLIFIGIHNAWDNVTYLVARGWANEQN